MMSGEIPAQFSCGERVRHAVFGSGTVSEVDSARSAYIIEFDGMITPRSISFRARLDKEE